MIVILSVIVCSSCDKCEDETKQFTAEFYPAIKRSTNNWDKTSHVSGGTIYFGISSRYYICEAVGFEEMNPNPIVFYTDREIVIGTDTISPNSNLMYDERTLDLIFFYKDSGLFSNGPQYLIQLNNDTLNLHDYYTFYFSGFTESGYKINDSTIVHID